MLVKIKTRLEKDGPWTSIDGWSFAELEALPRIGELVSLSMADHTEWLRVEQVVHTPKNLRPTSGSDERPFQAILFATWLGHDVDVALPERPRVLHWDGRTIPEALRELPPGTYAISHRDAIEADHPHRIRSALRDKSGTFTLTPDERQRRKGTPRRRWRT